MAAPLPTSKRSVDLNSVERVSRIRRDPPPKLKEIPIKDPDEVDRQAVVIGVTVFALALFVIVLTAMIWAGWTPRSTVIHV
ncbi:hypothetical protein [Sphingomonas jaspsi]|uniref:hypothetical protein n=1 Tax=Sphingomonas jaspsi TaxID=392409 RepID=UPI0004B24095|nr:hypothetical protein [Sphingomonas jaspsi]